MEGVSKRADAGVPVARVDYGNIIGEAWRLTWRHRALWVLGLFAAGGSGVSANLNLPSGTSMPSVPSDVFDGTRGARAGSGGSAGGVADSGFTPDRIAGIGPEVLAAIAGVLVLIVLVVLAIFLVFFVLSTICQGGMAAATVELGRGRRLTLGQAWREGLRLFWRFVALNLIQFAIGVVVLILGAAALLASFGAILGAMGVAGSDSFPGAGGLVPFALLGFLVGIVISVVSTIVLAYALRSIPARDAGPLGALSDGWRLFRGAIGTGLMLWLLTLVLGLAYGMALGLGLLVLAIPLGLIGVLIGMAAGQGTLLIGYIVIAVLIALVVVFTASAGFSTFQWHFWTQAYLRLTGETGSVPGVAPVMAPAGPPPPASQPFPRLN